MKLRNCLILAFFIGATPMCFAGESFGFYYNVDRGGHSAGGNYQFSEPGPGPRFGPGPHHFAPPPHLLQDQCGAHHLLDILDMDHGHVDHVTHITIIRIGNLVRID